MNTWLLAQDRAAHSYHLTIGLAAQIRARQTRRGWVMLTTRLDRMGLAAALRETSTVFAALIGRCVLGEKVGPWRGALMGLIALGAVVMEGAA